MAAEFPFRQDNPQLQNPPGNAIVYTPTDGVELTTVSRGLICKTAGVIRVVMAIGGNTLDIPVVAGVMLPIQVRAILSSGTTAQIVSDGVVVLW